MSTLATIDIGDFADLRELAQLEQTDTIIDSDMFRFAGNALFWYLVPTLISPERPESNFWPGLTGVLAAGAVARGTMPSLGSALGLGTVTLLWLTRGNARLWG